MVTSGRGSLPGDSRGTVTVFASGLPPERALVITRTPDFAPPVEGLVAAVLGSAVLAVAITDATKAPAINTMAIGISNFDLRRFPVIPLRELLRFATPNGDDSIWIAVGAA
jgi:hypothetical protein